MAELIATMGVAIAVYSVFVILRPAQGLRWVVSMDSARRFYLAIIARVVLGTLFIATASDCSRPQIIRVIGLIALAAAVVIAVMGRDRLDGFVGWMASKSSGFVAAWMTTGFAFGLLIIWASVYAGT